MIDKKINKNVMSVYNFTQKLFDCIQSNNEYNNVYTIQLESMKSHLYFSNTLLYLYKYNTSTVLFDINIYCEYIDKCITINISYCDIKISNNTIYYNDDTSIDLIFDYINSIIDNTYYIYNYNK